MGYDISDYYNIAEQYGTVEDVEQLIEGCHEREMRLLMDLVVNHTSDQHEWFLQSRSSKDNEYRNWYIWKPPIFDEKGDRHPPNNWAAHFEGAYRSNGVEVIVPLSLGGTEQASSKHE
jgi:glycosidase